MKIKIMKWNAEKWFTLTLARVLLHIQAWIVTVIFQEFPWFSRIAGNFELLSTLKTNKNTQTHTIGKTIKIKKLQSFTITVIFFKLLCKQN